MNLLNRCLKLAHAVPETRRHLVPLIRSILAEDLDWSRIRRRQDLDDDINLEVADTYPKQLALLKTLQAGNKVEIESFDSQHGGSVKYIRTITYSWEDLKKHSSGDYPKPKVILQPKVPGHWKDGMIADYGSDHGLVWQPTMVTPIRGVTGLRRV